MSPECEAALVEIRFVARKERGIGRAYIQRLGDDLRKEWGLPTRQQDAMKSLVDSTHRLREGLVSMGRAAQRVTDQFRKVVES